MSANQKVTDKTKDLESDASASTIGSTDVPSTSSSSSTVQQQARMETDEPQTPAVKRFYDVPNREYYVCRSAEHFIKWHTLSKYFEQRLLLDEKRCVRSLAVLREPQRLAIDTVRVCDPKNLEARYVSLALHVGQVARLFELTRLEIRVYLKLILRW